MLSFFSKSFSTLFCDMDPEICSVQTQEHQLGQTLMLGDGLSHTWRSNSSQRISAGFRSGLCVGQSISLTTDSANRFYINLSLCTGALLFSVRKGTFINRFHKVELSRTFSRWSECKIAGINNTIIYESVLYFSKPLPSNE